jgi:hypothetical protein
VSEIKLTAPQERALRYLAKVPSATPGRIGEAMYHEGWRRQENHLSAQGCGRIGGTMAQRLVKLDLVKDISLKNDGWPLYAINENGRRIVAKLKQGERS